MAAAIGIPMTSISLEHLLLMGAIVKCFCDTRVCAHGQRNPCARLLGRFFDYVFFLLRLGCADV